MSFIQTPWGKWTGNSLRIHVSGKILLLKSLSKDIETTRTDFMKLPPNLTLAQAAEHTRISLASAQP
jgi:hypothetical protein